jgi:hypothetical protein
MIVYFGRFLKITKVAHILSYSLVKVMLQFWRKIMGWAIFWATFFQTHLVTLVRIQIAHTQK